MEVVEVLGVVWNGERKGRLRKGFHLFSVVNREGLNI